MFLRDKYAKVHKFSSFNAFTGLNPYKYPNIYFTGGSVDPESMKKNHQVPSAVSDLNAGSSTRNLKPCV